jgi:hypothetical protein
MFGAIVVLALGLTASAMTKADFSGTWKLDTAKSTGLPPGMDQTMNVFQNGENLKLETIVKGAPNGDQTVPDSYLLDGKEHDFKPGNNPNAKGKRTAKMNSDGNGFEVSEKAELETPDGERVTIEATRKWTLSADGKQLSIELKFKTPEGEKESKRIFVKQ